MLTTKTKPGRAPLGQLSKPWDAYDIEEKNDPLYRPKKEKRPKVKVRTLGPKGFPMCYKGLHEMTPYNTYTWNEKAQKKPIKVCKRCHSIRMAESYQRRKAKKPKIFKEVEKGPNDYPLCSKKLHEMSPHNLYVWEDKRTGRIKKICKSCHNLRQKERYQEKKAMKDDSN